ncbi:MAG TPA: M3 family oligoendopeptidase [Anaerolineales bacterium]|nr:M3 family oligoendopeptidase [Anaerolineales bacterium]
MVAVKYEQKGWTLDELFPGLGTTEIEQALEKLDASVSDFEKHREQLTANISEEIFVGILQNHEGITRQMSRVGAFASLSFSENTQDQKVQAFMAQTQQFGAQIENRILFFNLWWKNLDDKAAARLLEASGDYRYWLEALRLQKPYTLSEPEEKIINLKDVNGTRALVTLYSTITNRYSFQLEVDGEEKELSREELQVYYCDPDPALRKAAYKELYRVYEADGPILGQIYQSILRDWRSEGVDLRGYAAPIAVRNLANDIPDDVVDTLLEVCRKNAMLFHRFFQLKARWLGVDSLRRYDIYAPVANSEKTYPYSDAVAMVLESFRHFDPRMADLVQRVFDQDHIDSEVRKGKRSGAFCSTVAPDLTPWVLQTYNGTVRNVVTMAHELGHAVHAMLADHHTALTQHSSLPLAETASTFAQMLLVDHLLEVEEDPDVRRDILFGQMDDAYATIMRQAYFALFERQAHERVHEGAAVDDLSGIYFDNLKDQFGDSLDLSEDFRFEWLAIPHFFGVPFYVYAYSFGQLLVLALYKQYKEEGEGFIPRYFDILSAGGSASPEEILTNAGIDMRAEAFWQGGFDVVKQSLEQLEAIEIRK